MKIVFSINFFIFILLTFSVNFHVICNEKLVRVEWNEKSEWNNLANLPCKLDPCRSCRLWGASRTPMPYLILETQWPQTTSPLLVPLLATPLLHASLPPKGKSGCERVWKENHAVQSHHGMFVCQVAVCIHISKVFCSKLPCHQRMSG